AIWKESDPGRDRDSNHDMDQVDGSEGEAGEALPRPTNLTAHLEYTDLAVADSDSTRLLQFLTD
ncbi:MAG: hypothetical protein LQ341_007819, partial [Variospora aurantia]